MIPIISIVGKSDSGKTTLIVKLVKELKRRGYKVGTIKHDYHGFEIDKEGKDSWRHGQAGSDTVAISSPTKLALIKRVEEEAPLDELGSLFFDDVDIVLTEGYKSGPMPKIEVHRACLGSELLCTRKEDRLIAVASDEGLSLDVPSFHIDDAHSIVDLIERLYLKKKVKGERKTKARVELTVNGRRIPLKGFLQDTIKAMVMGLISTLKGTKGAQRVSLTIEEEE